jgi:hypothetical protein
VSINVQTLSVMSTLRVHASVCRTATHVQTLIKCYSLEFKPVQGHILYLSFLIGLMHC